MKELSLACTLGPAELRERAAAMARGRGRDRGRGGRCCAFLTMDLRDDRADLVLTVGAPAGAEPVLDGLVAAVGRTA